MGSNVWTQQGAWLPVVCAFGQFEIYRNGAPLLVLGRVRIAGTGAVSAPASGLSASACERMVGTGELSALPQVTALASETITARTSTTCVPAVVGRMIETCVGDGAVTAMPRLNGLGFEAFICSGGTVSPHPKAIWDSQGEGPVIHLMSSSHNELWNNREIQTPACPIVRDLYNER